MAVVVDRTESLLRIFPVPRTRLRAMAMPAALGLILVAALWLRLPGLTAERFHEDEAIYSAWALQSATGHDVTFDHTAIDKPPVYLTLLALAFRLGGPAEATARWPNVIAGLAIILLTYRLGTQLYDRSVGFLAALMVALSPFAIAFGPTVFTDPWMVVFVLAALDLAAGGHAEAAGLAGGLAAMTKPTALIFLPLILAMLSRRWPGAGNRLSVSDLRSPNPGLLVPVRRFLVGFGLPVALGLAWDAARHQRPGFLFQGAEGYGLLSPAPLASWGERLTGWLALLNDFTAVSGFNLLALAVTGGLLVWGFRHPRDRQGATDRLLAGFILFFLFAHEAFTFRIWDRYLLGILPLTALLVSRAFLFVPLYIRSAGSGSPPGPPTLGGVECFPPGLRRETGQPSIFKAVAMSAAALATKDENSVPVSPLRVGEGPGEGSSIFKAAPPGKKVRKGQRKSAGKVVVWALLFAIVLTPPAIRAAQGGYPLGGDHGAYQGIDRVAAYLSQEALPHSIIFHYRLRRHFAFYLFDAPFDFRWYSTPDNLARQAAAASTSPRYIVMPAWHNSKTIARALASHGLRWQIAYRTHRRDGTVSFTVYRITGPFPP